MITPQYGSPTVNVSSLQPYPFSCYKIRTAAHVPLSCLINLFPAALRIYPPFSSGEEGMKLKNPFLRRDGLPLLA
jgi:hypothetical protein